VTRPLADPRWRLLMVAALDRGPRGTAAFDEWRASTDLQSVDYASQRVLPSLQRHLTDQPDGELAHQVRNVLRFTWLRSQILVSSAANALAALDSAGVETMLIKGGAVLHHGGWQIAQRPMEDINVLVPLVAAAEAAEAMMAHGFHHPWARTLAVRPEHVCARLHSIRFAGPMHAEVDLHWRALTESRRPGADEAFWAHSESGELRGIPTRVLSLSDTLLQVIANGEAQSDGSAIQWAIDAVQLIESDAIDWDYASAQAAAHGLAGTYYRGLEVLREFRPEQIPAASARRKFTGGVRAASHRLPVPGEWAARRRALIDHVPHGRPLTPRALWTALREQRAAPPFSNAATDRPVQLGDVLRFGEATDGTPTMYLGDGWFFPEPDGVWSRDRAARVTLPLSGSIDSEIPLTIRLRPFLAPDAQRCMLRVVVDGKPSAVSEFVGVAPEVHELAVLVPAKLGRTFVDLTFVVDKLVSPMSVGLNDDPRSLGIALDEILVGAPSTGAS